MKIALKDRSHWWVLPLAAMFAVLPLVTHGASCGHDFNFHLGNWMEVQQQWTQGTLLPRWSFRAAWGAGEPRFLFYPPVSWMLGAACGAVVSWTWAATLFTFVTLLLSGFTMQRFAREYVSHAAATAAACLYLANPYMLFTAYERTAYAELLAAAWMPLLLQEALRPKIRSARLAVPVALLWLTNAPAAVVGSYSLAVIGVVRLVFLWREKKKKEAKQLVLSEIFAFGLGLALAGMYLVPVLYERHLVQITMVMVDGMKPWQNFLFMHTSDPIHDAVLHTVSVAVMFLLGVAAVSAGFLVQHRKSRQNVTFVALSVLSLVIIFLLTPASSFVWKHAPQLAFLQFPWRFAAIEGAVVAMLVAFLFDSITQERAALIVGVCVVLTVSVFAANYNFRQYCDEEDNPTAYRQTFLKGTGDWPTDEYTPIDADNDSLARDNPPYWLAQKPGAVPDHPAAAGVIEISSSNPYDLQFSTPANAPPYFVLNRRAFRGWQIFVNGERTSLADARNDGLISVALPQGRSSEVRVVYRWTWDQYAGLGLSFLGLLLLTSLRGLEREAVK